MKKIFFILVLILISSYGLANYRNEHFVKTCKCCGEISHEIQMYAYNSWTESWQKSWRSDTNRPGCCEKCYFELQPKVKFLEKEKNAYMHGWFDDTNNGNISLLRDHERWWNNGMREVMSKARPLGLGWRLGRLPKK